MNSVQENKQELQAAIRACESAISRANATIESMEFRQQAATKMWNENKGREESLAKELASVKEERDELVVFSRLKGPWQVQTSQKWALAYCL